jgi:hypothetical protein
MKRGIMLIMMVALFCSLTDTLVWGKKAQPLEFAQSFPSGWSIVGMKPTGESERVTRFEGKMSGCEGCEEMIHEKFGSYLLFRELRKTNYENWWTVVCDIPDDQFLTWHKGAAKFIMKALGEQDTVRIESQCLAVCKGWAVPGYPPKGSFQNSVYFLGNDYFQKRFSRDPAYHYVGNMDFQIRSFQENPRLTDFEWSDQNVRNGRKYVVFYVYFGEHLPQIKNILGFDVEGMDSYGSQTTTRR